MNKKLKWTLSITVLVIGVLGSSAFFMADILAYWITPNYAFDESRAPQAPDYSKSMYWAASPGKSDFADMLVAGETDQQSNAKVDVFYIHPTAYYAKENWNSDMGANKGAAQVVEYMLAAHGSIFNNCCKVYAPKFREAHIRSFAQEEGPVYQALDLAYSDVVRAFEYFIRYQNKGRPFILLGHSQGTAHGMRLIEDYIEPKGLNEKMVAAYLIGYEMPIDKFDNGFKETSLCSSAVATQCIVTWATFGESGDPEQDFDVIHWYPDGWQSSNGKTTACINPLSWESNEELVQKSAHMGAVTTGDLSFFFKGALLNKHTGQQPTKLSKFDNHTYARCQNGRLLVEAQIDNAFSKGTNEEKQNYHGVDINLFYMNIRENVKVRIANYMTEKAIR